MRNLLAVCTLAACGGKEGPSFDALMKKNAPLIEPKLAVLETIAKTPLPEATGSIKLSGPMIEWISKADDVVHGNATFAFDADLKDLNKQGHTGLRTSNIDIINDCYSTLRRKKIADWDTEMGINAGWENESVMKDTLVMCPALEYLVVAKVDAFHATTYIDAKTFGGGGAAAQILVFDLDTGAYLGGVKTVAVSSERTHDASVDLAVNFYKAVDKALNDAIPGATLPYRSTAAK